ncbi:MAG: hypothetical protein OQJ94_03505, partial [Flavobacteriales bacterium]|nr:hypothetical protein [Flavobacteriales bacterium]
MKVVFKIVLFVIFYLGAITNTRSAIVIPTDTTKSNQQIYYFISNRDADDGTFTMYKARTNQSGISSTIIKGNFEVKGYPHMRKAEISVYNISTDELVGVYKTNPKTGNYLVILIPNVKYEFVINTYGY